MAAHGFPLWGDRKYNPAFSETGRGADNIALSAYRLNFVHPVSGRSMEFCRQPDQGIFHIADSGQN